jgi:hypothetical protein
MLEAAGMPEVRIHRHSTGPQGALVNAYLVETSQGVVAVDGTLTVPDGRRPSRAVRVNRQTAPGRARHARAPRPLRSFRSNRWPRSSGSWLPRRPLALGRQPGRPARLDTRGS